MLLQVLVYRDGQLIRRTDRHRCFDIKSDADGLQPSARIVPMIIAPISIAPISITPIKHVGANKHKNQAAKGRYGNGKQE